MSDSDKASEAVQKRVYNAIDHWDQERHDQGSRGSTGRLLFYVQEAFNQGGN